MNENLLNDISTRFNSPKRNKLFPDFISDIHFPYFKGLERNSVVSFNYPLTVLVGENGCGKSSVLQALENSIEGKSFSQRWFSTSVDPIPSNERPCFWYTYFNAEAKKNVQILKTRIQKIQKGIDNPDYWEPSRPVKKYGMDLFKDEDSNTAGAVGTRWKGTKRDLIYIDFRAEITSFDKYFYFEDNPHGYKTIRTKQDYLRRQAKYLKEAIDGKFTEADTLRGHSYLKSIIDLSEEEVKEVSSILDKKYSSIKILYHKFYMRWGESVYFSQNLNEGNDFSGQYSEAFAGSGESAVAKLVHKIYTASNGSLVLLDEPEVSLHPGAQKRLLVFLLYQIEQKGLQIVLSTHSPSIVEELPSRAIVGLSQSASGKFRVHQGINADVAFQYIGHTNIQKKKIFVEDLAAKELLERVLELIDKSAKDSICVTYHNGGAKNLLTEMVVFSRIKDVKTFVILDGDQKHCDISASDKIADAELDDKLLEITGITVKNLPFIADSGKNKEKQLVEEKKKYIDFLRNHLFFFPTDDPEQIMWEASSNKPSDKWMNESDYKIKIANWVKSEIGEDTQASDIDTYRKRLLKNINSNDDNIQKIMQICKQILDI